MKNKIRIEFTDGKTEVVPLSGVSNGRQWIADESLLMVNSTTGWIHFPLCHVQKFEVIA